MKRFVKYTSEGPAIVLQVVAAPVLLIGHVGEGAQHRGR